MGKKKKVSTMDLLQQLADKNHETNSTLKRLRQDRTENKSTERSGTLNSTDAAADPPGNQATVKRTKTKGRAKNQLDLLLQVDTTKSENERILLAIDKDCIVKFEKMALGISYKMGIKTTRNDLIRKVLLDYTNKNYDKLITLIEHH
ncbi:hypothetical protein [Arenibacter amylolyticus]|uniref:hypothetical protein n=1 Tax=Arenibacter amylolyticus TaxID=1406873 RepID=UPI000A3BB7E2|nr:hypothetical protein [Arenibacter amylolyticus]